MFDLHAVTADEYARDVLPQTAALWGGAQSEADYVAAYRALASSGWGRRRLRTVGLHVDGVLVASCKRYARRFRCNDRTYASVGIGAVFTPPAFRGRGYATAMLGALLDQERAAGSDLAYLFSDIRPAFYAALGFERLPSRTIVLRADSLPAARHAIATIDDVGAVRRTFEALDARRTFAFERTPLDWEWLRARAASRAQINAPIVLGVRRGRALAAYVTGRRIAAADTFVIDEFAFQRETDAAAIAPLLRAAAGDLRKVSGWLPPRVAREELPRGAVRARKDAIAMILPLSRNFRTAWTAASDRIAHATSDPVWSADHI